MFRLLKLAAYALIGYVIYEMWQGMSQSQGSRGGQRSMGGGRSRREIDEASSATSGMTGGGRGMMAEVVDSSGAESRRPVGRGVV